MFILVLLQGERGLPGPPGLQGETGIGLPGPKVRFFHTYFFTRVMMLFKIPQYPSLGNVITYNKSMKIYMRIFTDSTFPPGFTSSFL